VRQGEGGRDTKRLLYTSSVAAEKYGIDYEVFWETAAETLQSIVPNDRIYTCFHVDTRITVCLQRKNKQVFPRTVEFIY